ncbi:hypothetical protein [Microcystis phage MaeS]|nr:hypothetical protein [Microcystis phage MaeS]
MEECNHCEELIEELDEDGYCSNCLSLFMIWEKENKELERNYQRERL